LGFFSNQFHADLIINSKSEYLGFHPKSFLILLELAINTAGSPILLPTSLIGIFFPITFSAVFITSLTENP
jgi:hypothetical protein